MKSVFKQYAAYNLWANQKMLETISQLTEAQMRKEIISSFSGVYKTLLHLLDAESIWWQRLNFAVKIIRPSDHFSGNFAELQKKLNLQSGLWHEWVANATDNQLQQVFNYQNIKGEQFNQPLYEVLLHLFNYGSYHRGQLVTILRQLGIEKIPPTDFIVWSRAK